MHFILHKTSLKPRSCSMSHFQEKISLTPPLHRVLSDRAINVIATEISRTNWKDYYHLYDCQLQSDILYTVIAEAVDLVAPVQVTSVRLSDKPWVSLPLNLKT